MLSNVDGVYYSISLLLIYQQCLRDLYLVINIIQNMPLTLESLLMFRLIGRNRRNTFISMRLEELPTKQLRFRPSPRSNQVYREKVHLKSCKFSRVEKKFCRKNLSICGWEKFFSFPGKPCKLEHYHRDRVIESHQSEYVEN